jgi:hypothetical protein
MMTPLSIPVRRHLISYCFVPQKFPMSLDRMSRVLGAMNHSQVIYMGDMENNLCENDVHAIDTTDIHGRQSTAGSSSSSSSSSSSADMRMEDRDAQLVKQLRERVFDANGMSGGPGHVFSRAALEAFGSPNGTSDILGFGVRMIENNSQWAELPSDNSIPKLFAIAASTAGAAPLW